MLQGCQIMTKKEIKISVIIPTYNSSDFIQRTIGSIYSSNANEFTIEIIIVDDCSDDIDSLIEITNQYKDIKLIVKKNKSNASESRNIGFNNSTGDFVFFLDSDDTFFYGHMKNRVFMHISNECGIIIGSFKINNIDKFICKYNGGDFRDYLFGGGGEIRSSTISIYKKFHKGTLFDVRQNKHQDWGFGIRSFDNNEEIVFDARFGVNLDVQVNHNRMSNKSNIIASEYFLENYNLSCEHAYYFIRAHLLFSLLINDKTSMCYYRKKIIRKFLSMKNIYKFRVLLLLVVSCFPSSVLRFIKNKRSKIKG